MNKTVYSFNIRSFTHAMLATVCLFFGGLPAMFAQTPAPFPHLVFHAELGGSEVLPGAVNTDAKALVTLLFAPDRQSAQVSGMVVKLDGTVTYAKIHLGITGQTGPAIFDLLPYINDRHIIGDLPAPAELLSKLLENGVYIDIRTTAHPNGEIRGQFTCETDLDFGISMNGSQAVPPNNSPAVAYGGIHFPLGSHDIVYGFVFRGLSGPIDTSRAGIYEAQPGQSSPIRIAKTDKIFGNIMQGLADLDTLPTDFLLKLREGKYYIILPTPNFPDGEIRCQIYFLGYFTSISPINGVQQVPPPSPPTPGFGFNQTEVSGDLKSLTTEVFINAIQPTSVKVKMGYPWQAGVDVVELDPLPTPGFYRKTYSITEDQLTDLINGRMFINATTATYPNGEIRGVMKNTLRKGYAFDLCGVQMVPPTNSDALGVAIASVDQANCYLHYKLITDGLASDPIDGYVAIAKVGQNGIPFHALANTAPIITGSQEIMAVLGPYIERDSSYMVIGTQGFPNGEIRGQVTRGFTCPEVVAVNDLEAINQVEVSPVPFTSTLNITFESPSAFKGRLVMHDIMGISFVSMPVEVVEGKQSLEIQTRDLPKGIYTLSLELPGNTDGVLLRKVVKVQ